MSIILPNKNTEIIVNDFISTATVHLTTISGIANTISLYPPIGTPGPGVLPWTGYNIPPAGSPSRVNIDEVDISNDIMVESQLIAAEEFTIKEFPIYESTYLAYQIPASTPPPTIEYAQSVRNQLNEQIRLQPDPVLSFDELPKDGVTREPNYKTNVLVPDDIVIAMNKYGVGKTPLERAHFLAQCDHESAGFLTTTENLSYSADGLLRTFPKYFKTREDALNYERQPEKIASRVYGNRMGNGDEGTRDGWKYKGRGYIQLTGKDNYKRFGKMAGHDWVSNPDLVSSQYKADSACLYWVSNKLSQYVVDSSIVTVKLITKRINNGFNGLDDRVRKFTKYWNELQKDPTLWS
jgi:putative chitinase